MQIKDTIVELMTEDVQATVDFYQNLLDFQMVASDIEDGKMYWAELQLGTFRLSLKEEKKHKAEAPFLANTPIGGSVVLCFQVNDIHECYTRLAAKCQTLNHPHITPCGAIDFSMKDINGYVLTFEQTT